MNFKENGFYIYIYIYSRGWILLEAEEACCGLRITSSNLEVLISLRLVNNKITNRGKR